MHLMLLPNELAGRGRPSGSKLLILRGLKNSGRSTCRAASSLSGGEAMSGASPSRVQRRLAAILAADVVGYSHLMGHDEEGTLSRVHHLRREILQPAIDAHQGRI